MCSTAISDVARLSVVSAPGREGIAVHFDRATYRVREVDRTATITITLESPSSEPITVSYSSAGGSASAGVDYLPLSGTVVFAPGETARTLEISVLGDVLIEGEETVMLRLDSVTNGVLGVPAEAVLTIEDNCTYLPLVLRGG